MPLRARPSKIEKRTVSGASGKIAFPAAVVSRQGGVITLHFESDYIQSQMFVAQPDLPTLAYTRTMMTFEAFIATPREIALIGLGGGSIAKWCYRHHETANLTVVEINPQVIAVRDVFQIPNDNCRFKVLCEDGAVFLAKTENRFDVLLIDCFCTDHLPQDLCSKTFYDDCSKALTEHGLMVVNICGRYRRIVSRIRKSFGGKVLSSTDADGNTVVFACKGKLLWREDEDDFKLQLRVKRLERKYRLGRASAPGS